MPEPKLIKCYGTDSYLLLTFLPGRTPVSPWTVDIRQIDGNHIQSVLLAKEDIEAILEVANA